MTRAISLLKVYLLVVAAIVLSDNNLRAQSGSSNSQINNASAFSQKNNRGNQTGSAKIKGTWQLPQPVKRAFYKSAYANWYIEKIVSHNSTGKTVYRFYINNGNLLDGDHHDSFLKSASIDISESGIILPN